MISILWADDEIDLLKPHIIYLEEKGYNLTPAKSGDEALDLLEKNNLAKKFIGGYFPVNYEIDDLEILKKLKKKNIKYLYP